LEREPLTKSHARAREHQEKGVVAALVRGRRVPRRSEEDRELISRHRLDLFLPGLGVDHEPEAATQLVGGIRDDDAIIDGRVQ